MPETKPMKFGDKTFKVRVKVPLKIMDDVVREYRRLEAIEDAVTKELESLNVRNMIFKAMVVEPIITDEYLAKEADEDDYDAAMSLLVDMGQHIAERFKDSKKKALLLQESKPEAPSTPS